MTGGAGATCQPDLPHLRDCTRCPRLAQFLADARDTHPGYHARPVPAFGDASPRLLIVGLAPGFHGANRTGRPFTGDYAGELLYRTLHAFGWGSGPISTSADDPLRLHGCRITNAVKCVPPENRPLPVEVRTCNGYLQQELAALAPGSAVLALGLVAHGAVLSGLGFPAARFKFAHGAEHPLSDGSRLFDSYHCSRYNTNTRRLTEPMFVAVFSAIERFLAQH